MHRLFQKHLPLDLVTYDLPTGGMFFFLNFVSPLSFTPHSYPRLAN